MWQLRRALRNPRLIESIPKRGYRLAGELQVPREMAAASPESRVQARRFAIAVLPLANLTGDQAQEYFSDGMTDALILRLAQIQSLRVISRISTMQYKDRPKPLSEIGAELNVDAVIEGSVFRHENRVRISAELVDTKADTHLWAGSYEREMENVFDLQSELATAIARNVTDVLEAPARNPVTVKPEAYEAYLRGRFCWFRFSAENFDAALSYFQLAAKLDPTFAQPLSGISQVWFARENSGVTPASESVPLAREAAQMAISIDEMSAEARAALGLIKFHYDWDWAGAEDEFRRSIDLNPNDPGTRIFLADVLHSTGRHEEGFDQIAYGLQIDPLNPACRCFLGWFLLFARRTHEAVEELQKVARAEPAYAAAHQGLWGAFYQLQDWDAALQEARTSFSIRGDVTLIPFESVATDENVYRRVMLDAARGLAKRSLSSHVSNLRIARLYAHAQDIETAFQWLERACFRKESPLVHLAVAWDWDNMRGDERFLNLLRRIGLPDGNQSKASSLNHVVSF
jgi:TolB-like protein